MLEFSLNGGCCSAGGVAEMVCGSTGGCGSRCCFGKLVTETWWANVLLRSCVVWAVRDGVRLEPLDAGWAGGRLGRTGSGRNREWQEPGGPGWLRATALLHLHPRVAGRGGEAPHRPSSGLARYGAREHDAASGLLQMRHRSKRYHERTASISRVPGRYCGTVRCARRRSSRSNAGTEMRRPIASRLNPPHAGTARP